MNSTKEIKLGASFILRNVKHFDGNLMLINGNIIIDGEVKFNKGTRIKTHAMNLNFTTSKDGYEVINLPVDV